MAYACNVPAQEESPKDSSSSIASTCMLTNITALQNGAGIKPIIPEKLLKMCCLLSVSIEREIHQVSMFLMKHIEKSMFFSSKMEKQYLCPC
jgi:hypothetical protein